MQNGEKNHCYQKIVSKETKQKLSESKRGSKHPNWKGGISFEPYCNKFNKELKKNVRDKFNNSCFICGKIEKENGKKLSVHHVNYNKGQGCGYSWSLIPLCSSCHAKTNFNRYYWFNLLNNYWLYYQPEKEILTDFVQKLFIPEVPS